MRYPYIALAVTFLVGACGQDPTAPATTLPAEVGRHIPLPDPKGDIGSCTRSQEGRFDIVQLARCLNGDL